MNCFENVKEKWQVCDRSGRTKSIMNTAVLELYSRNHFIEAATLLLGTSFQCLRYIVNMYVAIVSAHRRILGLASVVCVLVKIRVSSISLYKVDTDKLTAPFESAHQFTLVCTVSDSKTVPGCHYNLCSNHRLTPT